MTPLTSRHLRCGRRQPVRSLPGFRPHPLALAVALATALGTAQAAPPVLNAAWIGQQAARPAGAAGGNGALAGHAATLSAQQVQRLNEQARLSIANLGQVAQAVAQAAEAQRIAREQAIANGLTVPEGLIEGGLKIDTGATAGWHGADAPTQTLDAATGKVKVDIKQTESKALLNWETFNVGRNTHVAFDQEADWAVLNRVNDPQVRPSQIQGQITGDGTVMIINRNGVIFSGSSQVSTGNLVAAAAKISDAQFSQGIYGTGGTATLTEAGGDVLVEAGAQIATQGKRGVLSGGGYVLLAGREAHNAGSIDTPDGQALLAAGDTFYIRKGYGTEENQASTTRGNEVAGTRNTDSVAGTVTNTGVIQAARGDVTLTGHDVQQRGVILGTSSVHTRGSVHLLNSASDAEGKVTLGNGSVTAVLVEDSTDTALDAQRDALIADSKVQDGKRANAGVFDNLGNMADRKDLSRIEIVSGGTVVFEGVSGNAAASSLALATGGQIAVEAKQRVFVADGARLDASGAAAVKVEMEKNNLRVNIQGYEQRDAPLNRDTKELNNSNVWVDVRDLILVPAGTNGYATDRYYTQGGLLEVAGYLGNQGHTAAERAAVGGTIRLGGAQVITQQGSEINLAGGSLVYQDGLIRTTWLEGIDGKLYELTTAPGDMVYKGLYQGTQVEHDRWGVTNSYYNLVLAPTQRMAAGYVVGRDGGALVVDADTSILEGTLHAGVLQGEHQANGREAGIEDGYKAPGNTVAQGGRLVLNGDTPRFVDVRVGAVEAVTQGLESGAELAADRIGTAWLDSAWVKAAQLGGVNLTTSGKLTVDGELQVNPGGEIALYGGEVELTGNAALVARGGAVVVQDYKALNYPVSSYYWAEGNSYGGAVGTEVTNQTQINNYCIAIPANCVIEKTNNYLDTILQTDAGALQQGGVRVADGALIDTRGLWVNASLDAASMALLPYVDGGTVQLGSSRGLILDAGSVIDASAGGGVQGIGSVNQVLDANGGDITLQANHMLSGTVPRVFELHATLFSQGTQAGGKLTLSGMDSLLIGDGVQARHDGEWVLPTSFFAQGFSGYDLNAFFGVEVAEGTQLSVLQPVLRATSAAVTLPTGEDAASIYHLVLPELFQEDAANGSITQRQGASLSLRATPALESAKARLDSGNYDGLSLAPLTIGKNSLITVDPGQSIHLEAWGQMIVDGTLTARGGAINVWNSRPLRLENATAANGYGIDPRGLSVWIGNDAVLDASGIAHTAVDAQGLRYGLVTDGGVVSLGHDPDATYADGNTYVSTDAFVVVRPDAVIDVSGARANMDRFGAVIERDVLWGSDAGEIAFSSYSGTYAEGYLKAEGGSATASGGTLRYVAHNPIYPLNRAGQTGTVAIPLATTINNVRTLYVVQDHDGLLPADLQAGEDHDGLSFRNGVFDDATRVSVAQVERGGFASLVLESRDNTVLFDGGVDLDLARSLTVISNAIGLYGGAQDVSTRLAAPYVQLIGTNRGTGDRPSNSTVGFTGALLNWQTPAGAYLLSYPTLQSNVLNIDADYLDIRTLGAETNDVLFDRSIAWTNLYSSGDIWVYGRLSAENNFNITAAQLVANGIIGAGHYTRSTIYGDLTAGYSGKPGSILQIARSTDFVPDLPYSIFGSLSLQADIIEQGGIVRLPGGRINIGAVQNSQYYSLSTKVTFLEGSLTSVSADGLVIPYGGTPDDKSWYVDGTAVTSLGDKGLTIEGLDILVAEGAVLDMSGGGEVTGAAFVAGRGGSTDVLAGPLLGFGNGTYQALTRSDAHVYAIVPSYTGKYAPGNTQGGYAVPLTGQQITLNQDLPGLPAGTYTLLPANYALLPGAFRVELGGTANSHALQQLANGSWLGGGRLGIADTAIASALPVEVLLTPADTVRRHSQYNETSLAAMGLGSLIDGGNLGLILRRSEEDTSRYSRLNFFGELQAGAVEDGIGGVVSIYSKVTSPRTNWQPEETTLEIRRVDEEATEGMFSLTDEDLRRLGAQASRLILGGYLSGSRIRSSANGNISPHTAATLPMSLVLRADTRIEGEEIFLVGGMNDGIEIEDGAIISTLGRGQGRSEAVSYTNDGGVNGNAPVSILAVSNNPLLGLTVSSSSLSTLSKYYSLDGGISIGSGVSLLAEGTIGFGSLGSLELANDARFGAKNLNLTSSQVHIGTDDALAQANLSSGWHLNTTTLARLLSGDTSNGAPGVETLTVTAAESINFIGTVNFDTLGADGSSASVDLVFNTPGFYGWGGDVDVATIRAGSVYLNGLATGRDAFSAPMSNGVGTGTGRLVMDVDRLTLGDLPGRVDSSASLDRLILGFSTVDINAASGIDINTGGSLQVYQSQENDYVEGEGFAYRGGILNISTPWIRTESGITHSITAGGGLNLLSAPGSLSSEVNRLGGALTLASTEGGVLVDTQVYFPSGQLQVTAAGDIRFGANARVDLSGGVLSVEGEERDAWGGTLIASSESGDILQDEGAVIDVSAKGNKAGLIRLQALADTAGEILLNGTLRGAGAEGFAGGGLIASGQGLGDFAALNRKLTEAGFLARREFVIKRGDVLIDGDWLRAGTVSVSADGGSLTVAGRIDASGATPGVIRLAAIGDLALAGAAVLDAGSHTLQVDSYGQPIDASNRAIVALTAGESGVLRLASGAHIDVSAADGVARGTVDFTAARRGANDIALELTDGAAPRIAGAKSVALNARRAYSPDDGQITQVRLDGYHADSTAFIDAARANAGLNGRLVALETAYGDTFRLRPAVEINSAATSGGNLTVLGDIDLARYRYGPDVDPSVFGSGEPGVLTLRAAGDLMVLGSISDGFGEPLMDDNSRYIATQRTGRDIRPHIDFTLSAGTSLNADNYVLEYDLPVAASFICHGCEIPFEVTLADHANADIVILRPGTVMMAGLRLPDGTVYQRGEVLDHLLELPPGTVLQPGWAFAESIHVAPMTLPAGTSLQLLAGTYDNGTTRVKGPVVLTENVVVRAGQLIPAGTTRKVEGIRGNYPYDYVLPEDTLIPAGTAFNLSYERFNDPDYEYRLPVDVSLSFSVSYSADSVMASDIVLTGGIYNRSTVWVLNMPIYNADGTVWMNAGQTVPLRTTIPAGKILPAGFQTRVTFSNSVNLSIPAGTDAKAVVAQYLSYWPGTANSVADQVVPAGSVIPATTSGWSSYDGRDPVRPIDPDTDSQGRLWATAPMLPAGSLSWSINLVSGADLEAADYRGLLSELQLGDAGTLRLSDAHFTNAGRAGTSNYRETAFSVLRTGTGDIELLAGRNIVQESLYGIYTAGTQTNVDASYNPERAVLDDGTVLGSAHVAQNAVAQAMQAYYPEGGGNLLLAAQGDISGRTDFYQYAASSAVELGRGGSNETAWWLWRAGDGEDQATAWWINFGNYVIPRKPDGSYYNNRSWFNGIPSLVGFAGIGTLGGGNLTVEAGGSLGTVASSPVQAGMNGTYDTSTSALNLVVGSSGRVLADGTLLQSGGGSLSVRAGGAWNPVGSGFSGATYAYTAAATLNGGLTNTRGDVVVDALSISSSAAPTLILGDSYATLNSQGMLGLGLVQDAGRTRTFNAVQGVGGDTLSWFSLWTADSGISLFSAGNNYPTNGINATEVVTDKLYHLYNYLYPATFKIYSAGDIALGAYKQVELAPAPDGQLEVLTAGDFIGRTTASISVSGADLSILATPWQPGMITIDRSSGAILETNYWEAPANAYLSLFNFGLDTTSDLHKDDEQPVLIYAGNDITNLAFGVFGPVSTVQGGSSIVLPRYAGAKPVHVRAGRDIVGFGNVSSRAQAAAQSAVTDKGGSLFTHLDANDISIISAGRDLKYVNAYVTGPGLLEVSAGRDLDQGAQGVIKSLGLIGDSVTGAGGLTGGADIALLAGVGESGLDYTNFARLYFDAANQADPEYPLGHDANAGKVAHTYQAELAEWLGERFGWSGGESEALDYYLALPAADQGIFARQVYFAELQASGREYNDPDSFRYHSYLRGRNAISVLFPQTAEGEEAHTGDITLYSALVGTSTSAPQGDSGIHTKFGGDIQVLAPYGKATFGLPANPIKPGQNTGVITHGTGDIRMYTQGSIVMGESRIFTTFGGAIQMWANQGDINAGMGPKSTIVYAPSRRVYDDYGNVALSPVVPSTGAGLATLAPIPEVPPGDMDLIAPEGVIDAGEAGIRVSGDLNIAALRVINVENIQVEGEAVGLPPVVTVDTGALTDASRTAAAAVEQVQQITRQRVEASPRIDVDVLGFGGDECDPTDPADRRCELE